MNGTLRLLLIIILVLLLVGLLPAWPYSAHWGYFPSGGVGLLLLVLIIVAVLSARGGPDAPRLP